MPFQKNHNRIVLTYHITIGVYIVSVNDLCLRLIAMSRTKFGRSVDRRSALKTIAASGAAVIGVGSSSGVAAAADETYTGVGTSRISDNIGDGYFEHNLGSALKCTNSDTDGGTSIYTFKLTGDGVVLNEDGEMPITEAEGYEDTYPRINHRGNVGEQGVVIERQYGDGVSVAPYFSSKEFAPKDRYANETDTQGGFGVLLDTAFTALGAEAAGYALTGAQLANFLVGLAVNGDDDPVWDFTEQYGTGPNGFLRGGHGFGFTVAVADWSSGGLVTAKSTFGNSEVAYDIQADHDGYSIYPGGSGGP
jgi:hypothetical protein